MAFPSIVRRIDDWINPIAVKEMRQSVNGRFIAWTLIVFLMVQLAIVTTFLLFSEVYGQDYSMGRNVFTGHLTVLLATCLFYLPVSTAVRLFSERYEQNIDLLFITTLQPVQIIWGKTLAAFVLMLLFFTASMPFMTLTYLLRGVDIPSIFILLAYDFLVVAGCVQMGILLACLPGKVISRGFRIVAGLPILIVVFLLSMQGSFGMLFTGIGSSVGSWDFWGPALTVFAFVMMVIGMLFILSVTFITPASANRALGARIYLLLIWLTSGVIAGVWSFTASRNGTVQAWAVGMVVIFGLYLFVSICERQKLGPRVLRAIPGNRILRMPAFFLYSGAASGISFSMLMIMGTIVMTFLFLEIVPLFGPMRYSGDDKFFMRAVVFASYIIGYALTALTIRRLFFRNSKRPNIAIEIILLTLMVVNVTPLAIGHLLYSGSWDSLPPQWYLANPAIAFWETDVAIEYFPISCLWAIVVFAVTLPWLLKQFLNFKPPVPVQIDALNPSNE